MNTGVELLNNDNESAKHHFLMSIDIDPNNIYSYIGLMFINYKEKHYNTAFYLAVQVLNLDPNNYIGIEYLKKIILINLTISNIENFTDIIEFIEGIPPMERTIFQTIMIEAFMIHKDRLVLNHEEDIAEPAQILCNLKLNK